MKPIFVFESYKDYINERFKEEAKQGRGQMRKMAEHLRVHSTLISHIFRGDKNLTSEQACSLTKYLKLSAIEAEFFLALVELERAGSEDLRRMIRRRLLELRERSQNLADRLPQDRILTEEEKIVFYSSWHYSAVRLLTSVPGFETPEAIATQLNLTLQRVEKILDFLLAKGLVELANDRLKMGPARTHLAATSPYIAHHHRNWRVKAMSHYDSMSADDLVFSAPMTISLKDRERIRQEFVKLLETISKTVEKSEPQMLACLNIDWLKLC